MGAQNSASGPGGNQSSVPAKNRFGSSNDVNRSIAERADRAAKKKLGIQKTVAGPVKGASSSVTGYMATNTGGNQMYGSAYNQARNQYLADQGVGTMTNGSFMPGVQTDQGLVFTSANRDIYNRTKQKDIPLSRQMYDSQQKFKQVIAGVAALAGVPMIPSALLTSSRTPYQSYVDRRESGVFSYQTNRQQNNDTNNKNNTNNTNKQKDNEMFENRNLAEAEAQRKKYLASLKSSDVSQGDRKFMTANVRGFGGSYTV